MAVRSPHIKADYRMPEPVIELVDGVPHAADFEDGYYSAQDGLAESRHVFLDGNNLASRMADSSHLVIAETGFGTGLNLLAVMAEMKCHPHCRIDFVSIEGFPLDDSGLSAAHAHFPEIAKDAAELRQAMPPRWPGYHLTSLLNGRLSLHLLYGDASALLSDLNFAADLWFLDGFAPARNPQMWSDEVLGHIGRLTAAGGTLASFTSAGHVRRGLAAAGFTIEKRPGFGRKREMITGVMGNGAQTERSARHSAIASVGIVGGGIAGASIAAALARRGITATIIESDSRLGQAGSGNRMALQSPRLTVDHNAMSRLSASCLAYAAKLADHHQASLHHGVVALDAPVRMADRHAIFRQQTWPETLLTAYAESNGASNDSNGPNGPHDPTGIVYPMGRVIRPEILIAGLALSAEQLCEFDVTRIAPSDAGVTVTARDGRTQHFDSVVLAAGAGMNNVLRQIDTGLPLEITSGQVSHVPSTILASGSLARNSGVSFGGYLTPPLDGLHDLGATFHKLAHGDPPSHVEGHRHNLALLPQALRSNHDEYDVDGFGARTGTRASLPDRRPAFGRISGDIFALAGLGARGFTLAPLLAELLVADMVGHAVPLVTSQAVGVQISRYRDVSA